jgi:hypothetical protein
MAQVAITSTAQPVTIPAGTPVTVSAACTLGLTQAGAASGPSIGTGTVFTWPGAMFDQSRNLQYVTLWVQTASTANLNYLS